MHIQFVGLPASGKTTIVDELINKYPDSFIRGRKRYKSISKLLLSNPVLFIKSIWSARSVLWISICSVQRSKVSNKNKVLAILGLILNLSNYKSSLLSSKKHNFIILWDELILQRTLSIFAYSEKLANDKSIKKFVKWSSSHCQTTPILVSLNLEIQLKRLLERGVPKRMIKMDTSTIMKVSLVQHETLKKIIEELENYIVIDTSFNINENINKIIQFTKQVEK
ncbi:hypothetical protein ERX46_11010 [Brumimicrobium glaciale]|uniref:Uncharacterized protein n=1 Tax=Brumimicrobium glaciale TaxID=200475 RepID=A0A4Q4KJN0_9FLAO|nr:hypothetical protein [Brumimicrobium glaciale]RYM33462.1 hypothetical protein ERX46_11010 [Brumimicrobium glaciale]